MGTAHSVFVDGSSAVWSCGNNENGQLGLGERGSCNIPSQISGLPAITSASVGEGFSIFLSEAGEAFACGSNHSGQLGLEVGVHNKPSQIKNLPTIKSILCAGCSSFFLDVNGIVWSCGRNEYGGLGLGDTTYRSKPQKISGIPAIKAISGGSNHSLFLDYDGLVWSCGSNQSGELGLGDAIDRSKPESIQALPKIKSISGGWNHSLFVDFSGSVWVCGSNGSGELGLGHSDSITKPQINNNISEIISACGGVGCSIFLDQNGVVFTCGTNGHGQLGLGDTARVTVPKEVKSIPWISSVSSFNSPNSSHFLLVDYEGYAWTCGENKTGQLGLGDNTNRSHFEIIPRLPKLKNLKAAKVTFAPVAQKYNGPTGQQEDDVERSIFRALAKEQSKELKPKIISLYESEVLNERQIKEKISSGVIPMLDWETQWLPIHSKNQQLKQLVEAHRVIHREKQELITKLQKDIEIVTTQLRTMQEEQETCEFYDEFLRPIARIEKELKSGFEEKLAAGKDAEFSVDEVSLFLNICGMEDLIAFQRENAFDGEILELTKSDVSVMNIEDALLEKKLKFHLKVLESGLFQKKQTLYESPIWRYRNLENTLLMLKELEIELDAELVRKHRISLCQLIYFKNKDFVKFFGLPTKQASCTVTKFHEMKKSFKKFLKEASPDKLSLE